MHRQKTDFIIHGNCKEIQTCYFELMAGYAHSKWRYQFAETFRIYLLAKNQLHSPGLWDYCKDMLTSHFWYIGHAWLRTPKMMVSTCKKLQRLSAYQKIISIIRFFLEILHFKKSCSFIG